MKASGVVAQAVIELIQQRRTLIQVLGAGIDNARPFEEIVKKLKDPVNYRPVKAIDETLVDRTTVYNPKLGMWSEKPRQLPRGSAKATAFTKKLSLTRLPSDGQMELYRPFNQSDTIALIYRADLCDLNDEKYIFARDMSTNTKWWLKKRNIPETDQLVHRSISLKELDDILEEARQQNNIPLYNDITACVQLSALIGIACTRDDLFSRVNTIIHQRKIQQSLALELSIVMITADQTVKIYSLEQQRQDLAAATHCPRTRLLLENQSQDKLLKKEKLKVILLREVSEMQMVRTTHTFNDTVRGEFVGTSEPGYWGDDSYSGRHWVSLAYSYFHDSSGYYRQDVVQRTEDQESLQWVTRYENSIRFLYEWSQGVQQILVCDPVFTRRFLQSHELQIDDLLSGLYEISNLLCNGNPDTVVEPLILRNVKVALSQVHEILAEWGYRPQRLPTHLLKFATLEIMQVGRSKAQSWIRTMLNTPGNIDIRKLTSCIEYGAVCQYDNPIVAWENLSNLNTSNLTLPQKEIISHLLQQIRPRYEARRLQEANNLLLHVLFDATECDPVQLERCLDEGATPNWNQHPELLKRAWKKLTKFKENEISPRHYSIVKALLRSVPSFQRLQYESAVGQIPALVSAQVHRYFTDPYSKQFSQDIVSVDNLGITAEEKILRLLTSYLFHSESKRDYFYQSMVEQFIKFINNLHDLHSDTLIFSCEQGHFPTDPEFCRTLAPVVMSSCLENVNYNFAFEQASKMQDSSVLSLIAKLSKVLVRALAAASLKPDHPETQKLIQAIIEHYQMANLGLQRKGFALRLDLNRYHSSILTKLLNQCQSAEFLLKHLKDLLDDQRLLKNSRALQKELIRLENECQKLCEELHMRAINSGP